MALVEFSTVESAICALEALQGKELSKVGAPSTVSLRESYPCMNNLLTLMASTTLPKQPLLQEQLNHGVLNYQLQQSLQQPELQQQPTSFNQPNLTYCNPTQNLSHLQLSSNENEPYPFPLPPPSLSDSEKGYITHYKFF
ncbi:BEM_collapsed_G0058320.mRNA.1.CDS.1 [Saccharomyces cerevisiae]|nr:BEM_collapsed_G0058320.mRNA.1.CDS.1 [Saccharomyces cerevisiae]